jgi:hypothetical protein
MAEEKRGMWVVFKMDKKMSSAEWKERFIAGYAIFRDMPALFSKCGWVDQKKNESVIC